MRSSGAARNTHTHTPLGARRTRRMRAIGRCAQRTVRMQRTRSGTGAVEPHLAGATVAAPRSWTRLTGAWIAGQSSRGHPEVSESAGMLSSLARSWWRRPDRRDSTVERAPTGAGSESGIEKERAHAESTCLPLQSRRAHITSIEEDVNSGAQFVGRQPWRSCLGSSSRGQTLGVAHFVHTHAWATRVFVVAKLTATVISGAETRK